MLIREPALVGRGSVNLKVSNMWVTKKRSEENP